MAMGRALVVVPRVTTVGRGAAVVSVPSDAEAASEGAEYDLSLLTGRLAQERQVRVGLERELSAAKWRAAESEVDAETVARARDLSRRVAALEVAAKRAGRREPSVLRLGAGLALLALLVLGERLWLLARWVWGCVRLGAVLLVWRGVLRWDRLDRGNVSPLTGTLCCAALFLGCVLAFGR